MIRYRQWRHCFANSAPINRFCTYRSNRGYDHTNDPIGIEESGSKWPGAKKLILTFTRQLITTKGEKKKKVFHFLPSRLVQLDGEQGWNGEFRNVFSAVSHQLTRFATDLFHTRGSGRELTGSRKSFVIHRTEYRSLDRTFRVDTPLISRT